MKISLSCVLQKNCKVVKTTYSLLYYDDYYYLRQYTHRFTKNSTNEKRGRVACIISPEHAPPHTRLITFPRSSEQGCSAE